MSVGSFRGLARLSATAGAVAVALIPHAAGAANVSPLSCAGPNACTIVDLYTIVFWIAMFVLVVVGGLIVYAALRFRRRSETEEPAQIHGNPRLEVAWTAFPLVILLVLFGLTFSNMEYIRNGPTPSMTVKVTGVQFSWSFTYDGNVRADTLRIPVGKPIRLEVTSKDVLHSFWAPRLGGQIYAIPGQTNHGWIQANTPGTYYGQCNELCGIGHWSMQLKVMAMSQSQFDAWYAQARKLAGG